MQGGRTADATCRHVGPEEQQVLTCHSMPVPGRQVQRRREAVHRIVCVYQRALSTDERNAIGRRGMLLVVL
eukprot:163976-Hanusia_phi.AAC.1